ncbi:MAG: peptidase lon domain protein [Deltaproteobacteria bacterium]|nr:peptidase lon domain protein [Deltaproteobacteria bacterium]
MGKMHRALALVAIALGCGGPNTATNTGAGSQPNAQKHYQPLTIKQDAKLPNQAVILGTDDKNGSTVVPLPALPTKGTVDAMFVRMGGGQPASGGSSPVKLSTGPNPDGTVQVGIYEELSGGAGPQWRAGVWVSAFVAANTLGKDLTDFTFSASSGGYIDGASASGLMAGGFLATLTGDKIDPTVTMTGIINPDGTIGPVGGIPEKFKGSIDKGKKRLGYPIGMRWTKSAATGKLVDLVQLAKDNGAEAIEISSVYDAYKLLTGKQLPEPVPVAAAEMALDDDTNKSIDLKYKVWQARLARQWDQLLQLQQAGRLPATLTTIATYAQGRAEQAERLHKQGLLAAAYAKMLEAWVYAASATDTYDVLAKVQAGDAAGAMAAIGRLDQLDQATVEVFKKIGAIKPSTMGGHLVMMGAYQAALRGWGFKMFAADAVGSTKRFLAELATHEASELSSPEVAERVVANVAPTVLLIGRTVAETALAADRIEFESEKSVRYMCSIPNVKRMSTSYQSASAAGITYFDTLLVQQLAESAGIPFEAARSRIAMREPNYLVAFVLSRMATSTEGLPAQLKQQWGESSLQWNLMTLAANELAYSKSAELVTKYYSLGVRADGGGRVSQVDHEKAFITMLASAERTARASARAARIATGSIPVQAKLAYQLALVQREGDTSDKIEALAGFWTSTSFSQTAVMLARN